MPTTDVMEQLNTIAGNSELDESLYEREVELCVKAGADEKRLREEGYNVYQLEQIRQGLEGGLDVSVYLHPQFSWLDMEEIRKGLKQGIDMSRYREAGYSTEQKREIRKGIARGVDVSQYDKKEYLGEQMREIRYGLMDGVPVAFFKNPAYDAAQMREIRLGLQNNLDISTYADPEMPYLKMRTIRESMEDGITFTEREIAEYEETVLAQIHKAHRSGVDIRAFVEEGYNALQLEQIRISLEEKLHFRQYIRKDMRGESLKEIRLGLEAHVEVARYAKPEYRWRQMRELRKGLEARVDIRRYESPLFEATQMRQIRLGLEKGLDVTRYNSLVFTAYDMKQMRLALERGEAVKNRPYRPDEVPAVYNNPVVPFDLRPDPRLLREALEHEKRRLEAKKSGRELFEEDADKEALDDLMPPIPDASKVPAGLYGGAASLKKKKKAEEDLPKIDMQGHNVAVTEDKMLCYLSLPKPKDGVKYTEELIHAVLAKSNVISGIDDVAIKEFLRDEKYGEQFVVARGRKPVNGHDGRYEYYFDRRSFTNPDLTEDGTADFSNVRFFSEVKAGDVIASYLKAEKGTDGFTVTGEVLPARNGIEKPVLKGRGFMLMDDKISYAAAVSGVAKTSGNELEINRLLTITENVVEVNKKIEFLGSVWVKAEVMPGTEIIAQGDVIFETVAESVRIRAGGDIVLKEGATGRTRGRIEAEGSVSGKYIANYDIHAKGSVFSNSFLHCNVETEEKLVCFGDNGTVYGGKVQAYLGMECAVVGTETGVPTTIVLGVTTKMISSYTEAEKNMERIASEFATIVSQVEKLNAVQLRTTEQMQVKIKLGAALSMKKKEYETAQEEVQEIANFINSVAGSESLISKRLYAGTTFYVDEGEIRINDTKDASEEKPIMIKGKAKQWKQIQKKS
ncbi:MAG: DUF342 domain-containing protein [Lachnospiraceae bacterium]|nr:DUF342 domain-containing protein [Lachnospiraceae bacterium]